MRFVFVQNIKRYWSNFHLKMTIGEDLAIETITKPKVLKLYKEWMKELNLTLPLGLREVNREMIRAMFQEGKEDYDLKTILLELDAGNLALKRWREGDRSSLTIGGMRKFNQFSIPYKDRWHRFESTNPYTPFYVDH